MCLGAVGIFLQYEISTLQAGEQSFLRITLSPPAGEKWKQELKILKSVIP